MQSRMKASAWRGPAWLGMVAVLALAGCGGSDGKDKPTSAGSGAEIGTERFVTPLPQGWRVVRGEQRGKVFYYHAEPANQPSAGRRDQIITTAFLGRREEPVDALLSVAKNFTEACETLKAKPPEKDSLGGLTEASQLILCGKIKGKEQGLVAFERMIRGEEGLYYASFQVRLPAFDAERGPPLPGAEFRVLTDFLGSVKVCDLKRPGRPCPAGEAPPITSTQDKPAETKPAARS